MYPKPYAEKTLKKAYELAGIDEKKSAFLHQYLLAAVNLYGCLTVRDLWEIFKEYAGHTPKGTYPLLHRKDLTEFSSIARREALPYYVFEIDELYCEEKRAPLDRFIVHGSLVRPGYGKFSVLYNLVEQQSRHPFYLPQTMKDFLAFSDAASSLSKEEKALQSFLDNLVITQSEYKSAAGSTFPCQGKGKRLKDCDFLTRDEVFEYEYLSGKSGHIKGNAKRAENYLAGRKGPQSQKIMRELKFRIYTGWPGPRLTIEWLTEDLQEMGVSLRSRQLERLLNLVMDFNNRSRLWCTCGWTPEEIRRAIAAAGKGKSPTVILGPGFHQAIARGDLDLNEVKKQAAKLGIRLELSEEK